MTDSHEDILRDHTYDGIAEYDNKLPLWWQAIFYITIVAAFIYVAHYHFGGGKLGVSAWEHERKEILEARLASGGGMPDEDMLRQLMNDPDRIAAGKAVYRQCWRLY